jgi:hypothetical protein
VQIVWGQWRGSRRIEHIGSARDDTELAVLRARAFDVIAAGQGVLDLGLGRAGPGSARIVSSASARLWDALVGAWRVLGFERAVGGEAFMKIVLARVAWPVSELDSIRVLGELGVPAPSYSTIKRRLRWCVDRDWRAALQGACVARAMARDELRCCLYDVTTLWFETDEGDGFREPGFSKDRRLEPQITVGLLTTKDGFPLMVDGFEGNKAEAWTMLPVVERFAAAHRARGIQGGRGRGHGL